MMPSRPCPPPSRNDFRPAGEVLHAELTSRPVFIPVPRGSRRSAQGRGVRYERKAQNYLTELTDYYIQSPWFKFYSRGAARALYCCPDGLLVNPSRGVITIVEIKLKHTADAWWQVRNLYEPVVRHFFQTPAFDWRYAFCEVVKFLDPSTTFPEDYSMVPDPDTIVPNRWGVHVWRP